MKKLIPLIVITLLLSASLQNVKADTGRQDVNNTNPWEAFYKHVLNGAIYDQKAIANDLQGNSLVLFTIATGGQLKNVKVEAALGFGLDIAIVNAILSYPNLKSLKIGKYALTTSFLIDQSKAELINKDIKIPQGYIALKKITVTAPATIVYENSKAIALRSKNHNPSVDPLVVLDGRILDSFESNTIDTKNIKGVTILRGLSAIADYGDQAKNGVIVIDTKEENTDSPQKFNMTIKWNGAATKTNDPLYIVDDEVVDNINTISPDKIKHITILKDASAFALYGDKGKNGVIIMYTKDADSTPQKKTLAMKWNGSSDKTNSPIYIVDDELVDDINTIKPDKIEHITILRNASAFATYGDSAKNGVVIITTKKEAKQINKP